MSDFVIEAKDHEEANDVVFNDTDLMHKVIELLTVEKNIVTVEYGVNKPYTMNRGGVEDEDYEWVHYGTLEIRREDVDRSDLWTYIETEKASICDWEEEIKILKEKNFKEDFLKVLPPQYKKYFEQHKTIKPFYEHYYEEAEYFGFAAGLELDGVKVEFYVTETFSSGEQTIEEYIEKMSEDMEYTDVIEIASQIVLQFWLFYNNIDFIYKKLILESVI